MFVRLIAYKAYDEKNALSGEKRYTTSATSWLVDDATVGHAGPGDVISDSPRMAEHCCGDFPYSAVKAINH